MPSDMVDSAALGEGQVGKEGAMNQLGLLNYNNLY